MDTLAHGLYGAALVAGTRDEKKMFLAATFGMLPDIIPYAVSLAQHGNIYDVNLTLYYATHNIFAAVLLLLLFRKHWFLAGAYGLHVFFDIFTHCGLFATRFLFPLSNLNFCTFNYGAGDAWLAWEINYGILIGIYYMIYLKWYKPYLKK